MKYAKVLLVLVTLFLYGLSAYAVTTDDLDYLCFTAERAGSTVALNKKGSPDAISLQYSTDKNTWQTYTIGNTITLSKTGDKVYFRATSTNASFSKNISNYYYFAMTGKIAGSGNIMSLLDKTCQATTVPAYAFCYLFNGCSSLTSAPKLPATTLASYCYYYMFDGCTSLVTAPELPATTLADYCCHCMFEGCKSLVTAPELPATTLAERCYGEMFYGCTSLVTAPELPATTLASYCYYYMFYGCTSLVTAPELPATTLAECCYDGMFAGRTSLVTAPELPATTLAERCYSYMFSGCTSLVTAPELPATTLAERCYDHMFQGCISLVTAPELPATTLAERCYHYMFYGCTSLVTAPELPATTLASYCYYRMFRGCTFLVTAPELPATTLAEYCYWNMFYGCTRLEKIKVAFSSWPTENKALTDWVSGVAAKGAFIAPCELPDKRGTDYIPEGWSFECVKEEDHTDIFLPYDATELTPEQVASNPIHLAYPTAMKDKMPTIQCGETKTEGVFSVSATTKVAFAPGNLQYQASTKTWRFAEHQYDYVGDSIQGNVYANGTKCDNAKISSTYSGWIDLFGWGTSGYNNKYPYMTSTTATDYGDGEKDIAGTNYDWGVYNQIGTDPKGTWRTLTKDEWVFLCDQRTNAANLKGQATVNGVTGLILLPDDWVLPSGLSFKAGTNMGFTANTYTEQQWTQMEAAGACFLPSAGSRYGTTMSGSGVQKYGYYWSSSHYSRGYACSLHFSSSDLYPQNYYYRYYGLSVRLVRNNKTEELPTYNIEFSDTICEGDVYAWHGSNYTKSGDYTQTVKSVYGTDSIVTLHLHVKTAAECGKIKGIGVFSVSANTKVQFSPGNLQYQASTKTWRFAEHQYDYVGDANKGNVYVGSTRSDNAKISSTYSGWIDLFGWGTSGYNNKYPYMTSTTYSDYGDGEKNIAGTNYDWGVYNQIGDAPAGTWRTLTSTEWGYLCSSRANATGLRGQATINGVMGFVFLPDNWVLPSGLRFTSGTSAGFSTNTYSTAQWSKMEEAGAVFLPVAGSRSGKKIYDVQMRGYYWLSSYKSATDAYNFYFDSQNITPKSYGYRDGGNSVRLVNNL